MSSKKAALITGLSLVLVVLVVVFFVGDKGEKIKRETFSPVSKSQPEQPKAKEKIKITLFFLSDDDDSLHAEEREIAAGASLADDIQTAVKELIKGSESGLLSPFPPETRIRQVFVAKDGTAYVDFTKEIAESIPYGASSEMAAVYALVNTIAFNFSPIKKVALLIEGGEKETLGGHIDLSEPFVPQYSLIAK